jgi:toxin ParE1/3/4
MVKIVWTDSAILDLEAIGEYISKDSIRYAEITVSQLFKSVDILEDFPKSGAIVPEFNDKKIRQLIRGSYRIVYLVVDEFRINILTVHNCARLLSNTNPFNTEE